MTKPEKISMGIGIAAGVAAGVLPSVIRAVSADKEKEPCERPGKLTFENGVFRDAQGNETALKILFMRNYSLKKEQREALGNRFGGYGASQVDAAYSKSALTAQDIAFIRSLGFNCVGISFSHSFIYPNGKIGKKIDFSAVDSIVEECCKNGLYVALNLTDSSLYSKKPSEKKLGTVWAQLAAHFKDDAAVVLYDTSSPYLSEKDEKAAYKAIRKADKFTAVISKTARAKEPYYSNAVDSAPVFDEIRPVTRDLKAAYESGKSVIFETFKSEYVALFTLAPNDIDHSVDDYKTLLAKYAQINNGIMKDEALADEIKAIFNPADEPEEKKEKEKKFRIEAGFRSGKNLTKITI